MTLTEEQEQIINYVKGVKGKEVILVDSVAGSGKTTLLKGIANAVTTGQAIYLAYNKAIATSSASGFPKHVDCRTTHSLAYQATVKPMKLSVGFFGPKQIDEKIPYDEKVILADDIREFCLSRYLTYNEYAEENGRANEVLANKYLSLMSQGKIEVSHDFYLKLFHILLHTNQIEQIPYELVMLDEAGDLNEVTLEIFKLLSGRIKIAVGDPHQNIYTFNHTINCFDRLKDQGVMFRLSKSFRVPQHIAEPVEHFCKMFLNPSMQFKGVASSSSAAITAFSSHISGVILSPRDNKISFHSGPASKSHSSSCSFKLSVGI
jgi:superfamily I DNA/RNA helicase